MCFAVMSLVIGGILTANTNSSFYAERAGYALAAQALTVQAVERVRAATWDTGATPVVDTTTNFPATTTAILELPIAGTNAVYATNTLSVSTITVCTNPACYVKMIQVTTTWPWKGQVMSNFMVAYRAPDQ
jgi:hypothetical protein